MADEPCQRQTKARQGPWADTTTTTTAAAAAASTTTTTSNNNNNNKGTIYKYYKIYVGSKMQKWTH